jgi:hypothetical protein
MTGDTASGEGRVRESYYTIRKVTRPTYQITGSHKVYVSEHAAYMVLARKRILEAFEVKYGHKLVHDPAKQFRSSIKAYLAAWWLVYGENVYPDGGPVFDTRRWRIDQAEVAGFLRYGREDTAAKLIALLVDRPLKDAMPDPWVEEPSPYGIDDYFPKQALDEFKELLGTLTPPPAATPEERGS